MIRAFGNAVGLLPRDAQLLADYADAMAMARGGSLEGEPLKLVHQALKAEPSNVKALALAGTAAFDRKEFAFAASYWDRAVRNSTEDSEFTSTLRASLDEARALSSSASKAETSSPASGPTAMQRLQGAPASEAHLAGRVTLAPELAERVSDDDTVFVFARATQGPRMPLAMIRARVKDLPLKFVLDNSTAMAPALNLSSADKVLVVARISRAGAADPQPGDIEGTAGSVRVGSDDVRVSIDRVLH